MKAVVGAGLGCFRAPPGVPQLECEMWNLPVRTPRAAPPILEMRSEMKIIVHFSHYLVNVAYGCICFRSIKGQRVVIAASPVILHNTMLSLFHIKDFFSGSQSLLKPADRRVVRVLVILISNHICIVF